MEDRIDVPIKDWEKLKTRLWQAKAALVVILCFNIGIGCLNMKLQDELSARNSYLNGKYTFDEQQCAKTMKEAESLDLNDWMQCNHYRHENYIDEVHKYPPEVQKKAQEILGYESRR